MHLATLQLAPVLGAEKGKVPFYIAGGLLVAWALLVSLGLGLRRPEFPGGERGQRIVMAISVVLVLAALSTAVITSGGSTAAEATSAPGASSSLALAANATGQLKFNTTQLSAKAGKVTITMTNMSPLAHNVTIARGTAVLGATPTFQGAAKTITLKLQPGTYTFYCSVPGHRQAGMQGTLKVS